MRLSNDLNLLAKYDAPITGGKVFTILTSCYNKSKYVVDCVNSIIQQDYRPLSLVWVDDRSSDGSARVIVNATKKLRKANISYVILSNRHRSHCSSSYKRAVENSNGNYFGILDADDALVPDACSFVAGLYEKHQDIAYIWTQFEICKPSLEVKRLGISKAPPSGQSLLDMGQAHAFSHWRTFSDRIDKNVIFRDSLKAAVDKYMGYRLEELGRGMFVNRVCYKYREGVGHAITTVAPTKLVWSKVRSAAKKRRSITKVVPFPIKECHCE